MADSDATLVPRNLTARAAYHVAGNPATSRPEDAVGNCYPGLELDVRNLDRRFFPGLVFDYVARDDKFSPYSQPEIYGARLRFIDTMDPELAADDKSARSLMAALEGDVGTALTSGTWYVDWVEQHGKRISMDQQHEDGTSSPLDGLYVWRIIRGLDPLSRTVGTEEAPVTVGLVCRDDGRKEMLQGWRRTFADQRTGVLSLAYVPGELLQSLCSPWQHDFRDCGCHYWASNHPDVVLGEVLPGSATLPDDASANPERANVLLDWLRSDRGIDLDAAALNYVGRNRPFQLDHYEINHRWQDLNVVVNDTEIGTTWSPTTEALANPFATPDELAAILRERLAPLEMALAIEYLYARFTIVAPEGTASADHPTLRDDVTFIRHFLLLTATSEMVHLRLANQLLWELYEAGLVVDPPYEPVLEPARLIPAPSPPNRPPDAATSTSPAPGDGWRWRPRALRPLTLDVVDDFIAIEHPDAAIDVSYQRVAATLRLPVYPRHLYPTAQRILNDGNDHYGRFRDIRRLIESTYVGAPELAYLRPVQIGTPEQARAALDAYESIRTNLAQAYADDAQNDVAASASFVLAARQSMNTLLAVGEELAAGGVGIPFWVD